MALVLGLPLLALDDVLDRVVLDHLLVALNLEVVLLLALGLLEGVDVPPHLLIVVPPGGVDVGTGNLFDLAGGVLSQGLLLLFESLSLCSLGGDLHVALAGAEHIGGALLGLIELLPSLIREE